MSVRRSTLVMSPRTRRGVAAIAALVVIAGVTACGSDDSGGSSGGGTSDVPAVTDHDMSSMATEPGMSSMNMGDADATPAMDVTGADLLTGSFELLDTRPSGYDSVRGDAAIARSDAGTTVTVEFSGLVPGVDYIAHLHDGACADGGGQHYKFDPNGSDVPPNEVHLAFTSDETGNGFMTAENEMTAGDDAISIVVHPLEFIDNKIACAEFG